MLQHITSSLIIGVAWSLNSYEIFDAFLEPGLVSMETMGNPMNITARDTKFTTATPFTTSFNTNASADAIPNATESTTANSTGGNGTEATRLYLNTTTEGYGKELNLVLPTMNTSSHLYTCPEEEQPSNIGPYEVPSQRDLMLHVRAVLLAMFKSYHIKALAVLRDMKEATKAAWPKENCASWGQPSYRQCVRQVQKRCEHTTKSLVLALENLRADVADLIQGKICNISAMNVDPIKLIRILAMEKVSLEFALPGFLRLLNKCAVYCTSSQHYFEGIFQKPARRMKDKELGMKYFLTRKGYSQLLKGRK